MPQTVRSRRGGKGLHSGDGRGLQKSEAKGRKLPEYLQPGEIGKLLEAAGTPRHKLLILLGWRAGLRVSEACALRSGDLFLSTDKPTLKVRQGKGRRDRIVPVHPELRDALDVALEFWGKSGDVEILGVHRTTAHGWLKAIGRRALPGVRVFPHILRHSAARHWLNSGVPFNVVSQWLGHANLGTTMIYLALVPDPQGFMENVE